MLPISYAECSPPVELEWTTKVCQGRVAICRKILAPDPGEAEGPQPRLRLVSQGRRVVAPP